MVNCLVLFQPSWRLSIALIFVLIYLISSKQAASFPLFLFFLFKWGYFIQIISLISF